MDRAKTATASKGKFQEKLKDEKAPRNKGIKRKVKYKENFSEFFHSLVIVVSAIDHTVFYIAPNLVWMF